MPIASYTHGPGIDDPLVMRYDGDDYFYHKNHLGSIMEITNIYQATVKTYDYDAFGRILGESGSLGHNAFTYTGREYHENSGLYYYRARFYDPAIGRFITQDPIGLISGPNLYIYVMGNPISHIDPTGLFLEKLWKNPVKRAQHLYDENRKTMREFIDLAEGRSLEELQHEVDEGHAGTRSAGGPQRDYRYVQNPRNPIQIIDMRHFLVIGPQGEFAGLMVEILQIGNESAFNSQDFLSNALGAEFFKNYDENRPLSVQLEEFFYGEEKQCP